MHLNYYFLRILTARLNTLLPGKVLAVCFSQTKDEAVFGFAGKKTEFFIRASLSPAFTCLSFPESFPRAKKNSADLFKSLTGLTVLNVIQHENERSFTVELEGNFKLLFKLHGYFSNIVLFKGENVIEVFRNHLKNDFTLNPNTLDRRIDQGAEAFKKAGGNPKIIFPTFGPVINQELIRRGFNDAEIEGKQNLITGILEELKAPKSFCIIEQNEKFIFSLFPLGKVPIFQSDDPILALNEFWRIYQRDSFLVNEKKKLISVLKNKEEKLKNQIAAGEKRTTVLQKTSGYRQIADIIMANLGSISQHAEEVELFDFYSNRPVKIKLKKGHSPQKNAENYYRKAKNQHKELEVLLKNINRRKQEAEVIVSQLAEIEATDDPKALKNLLKSKQRSGDGDKAVTFPFKRIVFEGFEILIGKSAKNNDLLIRDYARKDDLWLHAKDVSGSHVVIKNKSGVPFPRSVIERAAELAAWFSKRKNDSLCPVITVPRKFVRKLKGAPAGSVVVEREKVVMVRPEGPGASD